MEGGRRVPVGAACALGVPLLGDAVAKCTKDKSNDVAKMTITVRKKLHCHVVAKCALRRSAK